LWEIDSTGTAKFANAIISGTLQSTVFEYEKVQTVAGAMLIRSGFYAEKVEIVYYGEKPQYLKITLSYEGKEIPEGFEAGKRFNVGTDIGKLKPYTIINPYQETNEEEIYFKYLKDYDLSNETIELLGETVTLSEKGIKVKNAEVIYENNEPIYIKLILDKEKEDFRS
jgi:hypothetical protein